MTDEMSTAIPPYRAPALRVAATYQSSDGCVPDEIYVEFGGDSPVDPDLVDRAVAALASVATGRNLGYHLAGVGDVQTLADAMHRAALITRATANTIFTAQQNIARAAAGADPVDGTPATTTGDAGVAA